MTDKMTKVNVTKINVVRKSCTIYLKDLLRYKQIITHVSRCNIAL